MNTNKETVQGCVLNDNYDFHLYMSILNDISQLSVETTLETMKNTLPKNTIIKIVYEGIKAVTINKTLDLKTLNIFTSKLQSEAHHSQIQTQSSNSIESKVFNIKTLKASIFGYLNFNQLIKCDLTCKQWLFDNFHPSPLYEISTYNMFRMKDEQHQYPTYPNMNRFKNVKSLIIYAGWAEIFNGAYFNQLEQFKNLEKLTLVGENCEKWTNEVTHDIMDNDQQFTIIDNVIKNNKQNIKYIHIQDGFNLSCEFMKYMKCWNTITLPNLKVFKCSENTKITNLQFIPSENKLHTIECMSCEADIQFWQQIRQKNLCNLINFKLEDTHYWGDHHNEIIQHIASVAQHTLANIALEPTMSHQLFRFKSCSNIQSLTITVSPQLYTREICRSTNIKCVQDCNMNFAKLTEADITLLEERFHLNNQIVNKRNAVAGIICVSKIGTKQVQTSFIKKLIVSLRSYCLFFSHIQFQQLTEFYSIIHQLEAAKTIKAFQQCQNESFWTHLKHLHLRIHTKPDPEITKSIAECIIKWVPQRKTTCQFEVVLARGFGVAFDILHQLHIFDNKQQYEDAIKYNNTNTLKWKLENTTIWTKKTDASWFVGVGPIPQN